MHLDWHSILVGGIGWALLSAVLHTVPPAKPDDPWLKVWFINAVQAIGVNLDRIKGVADDSKNNPR